ncbi:sugar-phosphatase [Erysipelotrichaceae bacterium]|nr:sugar-phosphatase [Erysipelotrichaceae bacterium]
MVGKTCFIADLDGTLLHKSQKHLCPSSENKIAIQEYIAAGNLFVIATGRGYKEVEEVCKNLEIEMPFVIAQNGALLYENGVELASKMLESDIILEVKDFIKNSKAKIDYFAVTTDDWNMHIIPLSLAGYLVYSKYKKTNKKKYQRIHISKIPVLAADKKRFCKILLFARGKQISMIEQELRENFSERLSIYCSSTYSVEICAENVGKERAIEQLLTKACIDPKKVGFVGDSGNDVGAFKYFEKTYAMSHAPEKYRQFAKYTVKSVAEAIAEFKKDEE